MKLIRYLSQQFILGVSFLCLIYIIFQFFYINYAAITVDEFWFSHRIYQFKNGLPYRDFSPYKTVLGYYFLLLPMQSTEGLLKPLIYIKTTLALLNAVLFFVTSIWLTRFLPKKAVFSSFILLIFAEFFLTYSTDIRVDLLGYWFCLIAVLLLFEKKYIWAGFSLGIGFLISQKVVWYIFASNMALLICYISFIRYKKILKNIILFNLAILLTVALYILFWGCLTNFKTVINSVFYEAFLMYQVDDYSKYSQFYWTATLSNNPLLFLLWPIISITLFVRPSVDIFFEKRFFIIIYSWTILLCLMLYKQVFPYYMVVTMPAFFLLYTLFFAWLYTIYRAQSLDIHSIGKQGIWALIFLYEMCLLFIFVLLPIPPIYLMIGIIPIILGIFISLSPMTWLSNSRSCVLLIILLITLCVGGIYPLVSFSTYLPEKNGRYQKFTLHLMDQLLQQGGDYVAGIELIYNRNQPIPGMRHLDITALKYLYHPSEELAKMMLPSLYRTPHLMVSQLIDLLENSQVKFYVNNYRMESLPLLIKAYLAKEYMHYWGSIYLYAPTINKGYNTVKIKFTGQYKILTTSDVIIDGNKLSADSIIPLSQGMHHSHAKNSYRLSLIPNNFSIDLNSEYKADNWKKVLS